MDLQLPILAQMSSPAFLLSKNLDAAKWWHVVLAVREVAEGWIQANTISEREGGEK